MPVRSRALTVVRLWDSRPPTASEWVIVFSSSMKILFGSYRSPTVDTHENSDVARTFASPLLGNNSTYNSRASQIRGSYAHLVRLFPDTVVLIQPTTKMVSTKRPILIVGATGSQAGALIRTLLDVGATDTHELLAVTRNPSSGSAKSLQEHGVKLCRVISMMFLVYSQPLRTCLGRTLLISGGLQCSSNLIRTPLITCLIICLPTSYSRIP